MTNMDINYSYFCSFAMQKRISAYYFIFRYSSLISNLVSSSADFKLGKGPLQIAFTLCRYSGYNILMSFQSIRCIDLYILPADAQKTEDYGFGGFFS